MCLCVCVRLSCDLDFEVADWQLLLPCFEVTSCAVAWGQPRHWVAGHFPSLSRLTGMVMGSLPPRQQTIFCIGCVLTYPPCTLGSKLPEGRLLTWSLREIHIPSTFRIRISFLNISAGGQRKVVGFSPLWNICMWKIGGKWKPVNMRTSL